MVMDFFETLKGIDPGIACFKKLETVQVNVGNRCNLQCEHCHVEAGPEGNKIMSKDVIDKIVAVFKSTNGLILDITGGSPELNPNLAYLIDQAKEYVSKIMVRSNLSILVEKGMEWAVPYYADNGIVLIGSLPCYTEENVDAQRGKGTYWQDIDALKLLNSYGYGDTLELDLVYNPGGDFLPGDQAELERAYKERLKEDHGIVFNNLYTITNNPIGRFKTVLEQHGKLDSYMRLLSDNFNPDAAAGIMCRTLVSVGYDGIIYNCDFNQALGIPITDEKGERLTIDRIHEVVEGTVITTGLHCYACTAGSGSSCTGALSG